MFLSLFLHSANCCFSLIKPNKKDVSGKLAILCYSLHWAFENSIARKIKIKPYNKSNSVLQDILRKVDCFCYK